MKKNKWEKLIDRVKFLKDKKYYKNNIWSMAAWDSWAARGTAGGCNCCSAKHYNGSLENKRYTHQPCSSSTSWQCNDIVKLCSECISKVEKIIDYEFKSR